MVYNASASSQEFRGHILIEDLGLANPLLLIVIRNPLFTGLPEFRVRRIRREKTYLQHIRKYWGMCQPGRSRTGALPRRFGLPVAPRFRWECLTIRTVSGFPAPATSHVASGFPAVRAPAQFTSRVMRPIRPERLPSSTAHRKPDTPRRVRACRTAIPLSLIHI